MKKGFWKVLGIHIIKIHSMYSLMAGLPLTLLLWKYSNNKEVSILVPLIVAVACLLIISALVSALIDEMKRSQVIPNIERVIRQETSVLVLVSQSSIFSHGIGVSLYYTDEHQFEKLICIGRVINIQENGKIQIKIEQISDGQSDIARTLESNDRVLLERITVKPVVSMDYLD